MEAGIVGTVVLELPSKRPAIKSLGGLDIGRRKLHIVNAKIVFGV
jgi:hypothetical protein